MKVKTMANDNYTNISTWGGAIGGIASIKVWLLQITHVAPTYVDDLMLDYFIKFIGTIILALVGSTLAPLGRDFYKYKLKPKIFKKYKDN